MYYFTSAPSAFWHTALHGGAIPDGAVPVTEARHAELLAGQDEGYEIVADANGNPILKPPQPPSLQE